MTVPDILSWHRERTFVVFGDMLGFGALVGAHPETGEARLVRATTARQDRQSDAPDDDLALEARFMKFNGLLNAHITDLDLKNRVTAFIFSDSFYIATDAGDALLSFSAPLMRAMILNDVPVRMGIGYGSFCLYRASYESGLSTRFHQLQFLGKGVVNSYWAESTGLKGMRIGINPSLFESDIPFDETLTLRLGASERLPHCGFELNYLHPTLTPTRDFVAPQKLYRELSACVERMGEPLKANARVSQHYDRTLRALSRMSRAARRFEPPPRRTGRS